MRVLYYVDWLKKYQPQEKIEILGAKLKKNSKYAGLDTNLHRKTDILTVIHVYTQTLLAGCNNVNLMCMTVSVYWKGGF